VGGDSYLVVGVDVHRWDYALRTSNSSTNIRQPINLVGMSQNNDALYLQNTTQIFQTTTLLLGLRNEHVAMRGADIYDSSAPGAFFGSAAPVGSFAASKNAYELGLRHQLHGGIALNGKVGRSFRFANVDEIYEFGPTFSNQFQFLRPQTSDGMEFGLDQKVGSGSWRIAMFSNKVKDEIHLDPFTAGVGNTNLPLSQRRGVEFAGKWQMWPQLMLNSALTYTDARILSGAWNGKHVPLVPSQMANLGASWSFSEQTRLNAASSYVGSQYMENDEANTLGLKIPAYALTDLKLVHQMGDLQLNASVNNLFDKKYYNYAVSSQFTAGKYNAYTLPGRTLFAGLKYQF
jgi:iron complex outermembrane receptor protein